MPVLQQTVGRVPVSVPRATIPLVVLGLGAFMVVAVASAQPLLAFAVPLILLAGIVAARFPALMLALAVLLTGTAGTITAFTPLAPNGLLDLVLLSLWAGVAGTYVFGRAEARVWLWPALIPLILYIALTVTAIPFAEPALLGINSFRASAWYMCLAVLVAIAPWGRATHIRIARGIVVVALAVGAYCLFRWITGPSDSETFVVRLANPGVPTATALRFFGSFQGANQLAAWAATTIAFCLPLALGWRGHWRLAALVAIVPLAIVLFAADTRTGIVAVAMGVVVSFSLYLLCPAFPGRLPLGLAALLAIATLGIGAYSITVATSPDTAQRFESLFDPTDDQTYQIRTSRWQQAINEIEEEPLGHGLGTSGTVAIFENPTRLVGPAILDSSYLKVGIEQGVVVMVMLILALLGLLGALAYRAVHCADRQRAPLMIGACGALAATMVMGYSSHYFEGSGIALTWIIVGLGVAQVTAARSSARA